MVTWSWVSRPGILTAFPQAEQERDAGMAGREQTGRGTQPHIWQLWAATDHQSRLPRERRDGSKCRGQRPQHHSDDTFLGTQPAHQTIPRNEREQRRVGSQYARCRETTAKVTGQDQTRLWPRAAWARLTGSRQVRPSGDTRDLFHLQGALPADVVTAYKELRACDCSERGGAPTANHLGVTCSCPQPRAPPQPPRPTPGLCRQGCGPVPPRCVPR